MNTTGLTEIECLKKELAETRQALATANYNLEQRIAERTHQLSESEKRFRLLADTIPQLAWITLADGKCEYVNKQWTDYTGQSQEQAAGDGWTAIVYSDDVERTVEVWNDAVTRGSSYEIEYRFLGKDGNYRWFLGRATPLRDEDGQIIRWFGTCTDIHDQKIAREQAQRTLEIQKELDNLKNLFMSVTGHELRTPLTSIRGYAQLLERNLSRLDDEIRSKLSRAVSSIVQQSGRMNEMITQLMDFSRLQNQQFELTYSLPSNLVEFIERIVERHRLTTTIQHNLLFETSAQSIVLSFDPPRLEQVFDNLITNAIKYSPPETNIYVSIVPADGEVTVCVRDEGSGIPLEDQPRIFDRFYRARSTRTTKVEGLGLGLYISHEIVVAHGGQMWLESTPGVGSTFCLKLPLNSNPAQTGTVSFG
jgi:PAS domain S-box-containing protein